MNLNPCIYCGSPAAEQIRGEFHKNNRVDVKENHYPGNLLVEMSPDTQDDFRIACSQARDPDYRKPENYPKCTNVMGWNLPTLKIAEQMRRKWNADNPNGEQQYGIP